jgi:hypothetical protein
MPAEEEILNGVTLRRSTLGGYVVLWSGQTVGWIHQNGDRWNAYKNAEPPHPGIPLGCYPKEDAVRRVAVEAGWPRLDSGLRDVGKER